MDEWNEWVKTSTFSKNALKPPFLRILGKDPLTYSFLGTANQQVVLILVGDSPVRPV